MGGYEFCRHTSWNAGNPVCSWQGVVCTGDRVTEFSWINKNCEGALNFSVLPRKLKVLDISGNAFTGQLNVELLPIGMTRLKLQQNRFSGPLDLAVLPIGMTELDIGGNLFNGTLNLKTLPASLTKLLVVANQFSGPLSLTSLPAGLATLNVASNQLIGPLNLTSLSPALKSLLLSFNKFNQSLELTALPAGMTELAIEYNLFSGPLNLGRLPTGMTRLTLDHNQFSGPLNLASLPPELLVLDASVNQFSGPVNLEALPAKLTNLAIYNNQLTGQVNLKSLPQALVSLYLNNNQLSGPVDLTRLPATLSYMFLDSNQFTGKLNLRALPIKMWFLNVNYNYFDNPPDLTLPAAMAKYFEVRYVSCCRTAPPSTKAPTTAAPKTTARPPTTTAAPKTTARPPTTTAAPKTTARPPTTTAAPKTAPPTGFFLELGQLLAGRPKGTLPNPSMEEGPAANVTFGQPLRLVALNETVIVADTSNHCVRILSLISGQVSTLAGECGKSGLLDGMGRQSRLFQPRDISADVLRGVVYVADTGNNVVRRISVQTGNVTTFLINTSSPSGDAFVEPIGISVVPSTGRFYVSDAHRVRLCDPATSSVTLVAGGIQNGFSDGVGAKARFSSPGRLTAGGAIFYVPDLGNNCIRKLTSGGVVTTLAGNQASGFADGPPAASLFARPVEIVMQYGNVALLVVDEGNRAVRRVLLPGGNVTTVSLQHSGLSGMVNATQVPILAAIGQQLFLLKIRQ
jgi:hypothetical protein